MPGAIDFHTHLIPAAVAARPRGGGMLPRMVIESPTCGQLYRGEKHDRQVDERTWDADRRLRDMDDRGVDRQVLSPVPVMFAYDCPLAEAFALLRLTNDGIAEVVRARPDRFAGLGGVPLQDVDAACAETRRVVGELGLAGIEIGTGDGTRRLDDPAFDPLWELCSALGALVFVHPDERAPLFAGLRVPALIQSAGYPSETGFTAVTLLAGGLFSRFPRLRMVLAHGGGTLPWLLARLDHVWSRAPALRKTSTVPPSELARNLFYDTLVYDPTNLRVLIDRVGVDRLVLGTDYPFAIAEDPPGAVVRAPDAFTAAEQDAMLFANAARLLEPALRSA